MGGKKAFIPQNFCECDTVKRESHELHCFILIILYLSRKCGSEEERKKISPENEDVSLAGFLLSLGFFLFIFFWAEWPRRP